METISKANDVEDIEQAPDLAVQHGQVVFNTVNFSYSSESVVIEDCSFIVEPGERVGLVGRSGAGKSTLVNLLLRFHDIDSGRISIDGHDISDVSQKSLRSSIGVVTQDTSLLHRSIFEFDIRQHSLW